MLTLLGSAFHLGAGEIRVGLIGLDTSHVTAFLQAFNKPDAPEHVPGARIVAAFKGGSPEIPASRSRIDNFTQQAVEKYGVKLCATIEELAAQVDAIMILSVDGRKHLAQFRRVLAAKKPVFIDKPMGGSLSDALEIVRLARENRVPCFSSSLLRFASDSPAHKLAELGRLHSAYSWGPMDIEPHHPDLFWYGIHSTEALYAVMGPGCLRVVRTQTEATDVVTGVWSDGRVGTMQGNHHHRSYGVIAIGSNGIIKGGEQISYRPLAQAVVEFFRTGITPVPLDITIEIHAFMEAADESKRRGGQPVTLAEVLEIARRNPARRDE